MAALDDGGLPAQRVPCTGPAEPWPKVTGIWLRSVQRYWDVRHLQPHEMRSFGRSRASRFEEKMGDIVRPNPSPPALTLGQLIDEKTQIQAFDRTPPGLPPKLWGCVPRRHPASRNCHRGQRDTGSRSFSEESTADGTPTYVRTST